jgi:addiction module RelB/DinJ family antitoxin
MAYKAVIGAQIDGAVKHDALLVLHELDITISQAVRLFFEAIVECGGMPFDCPELGLKRASGKRCSCELEKTQEK